MGYQPKVIRCRLHTGGQSMDQIRERYRGQGLTYRDFESLQRANEAFDGLVVVLSLWSYDDHADYHLYTWGEDVDARLMEGIYHCEQVHPFPRYKGRYDDFAKDWKAGNYDPGGCSFVFPKDQVEEIETICEEMEDPDNGKEQKKAQRTKRRKKKRRIRRKK